jgi:hypothetical protein
MWNCNAHVSFDADFALGYLHHVVQVDSVDDISEEHVVSSGWRRVTECYYYVRGIMENRVKSPNVTSP